MSAREVFFLIGRGGVVLHRDEGEGPTHIPDSRARWEAIWAAREELEEIAHSHPVGPLAFSAEDESTMAALATALGRDLVFSVVTADSMLRRAVGPAGTSTDDHVVNEEPAWANDLRRASAC